MFQDFATVADPSLGCARAAELRERLAALKLDAFLVPRADEHQGEYVPPSAERLKWLTGFSGSAGLAIVARKSAVLLVDGRYTLQARHQVDTGTFAVEQVPETEPKTWLERELGAGAVVGFDPWLHTAAFIRRLAEDLGVKGIKLKPLSRNPVDAVWGRTRPARPKGQVRLHPVELAGRSAADKIADLQRTLKDAGEAAAVLTAPDSISWLLNIRGEDIPHTPSVLAFMIAHAATKPELFIDPAKLDAAAKAYLSPLVRLRTPSEIAERIAALKATGKRVRLTQASAAWWFWRALGAKARTVVDATDPCVLPKARKTEAEIAGARAAHERDGVAMARFLAWLDREAPTGRVDEISAVRKLEDMRRETQALREISFDTISGSGPNGAIVHYRVSEATNRRLHKGELFLVDSGAQYADGTTDITRTVVIGAPTAEMRERFTLVLKGHIAVARAIFPKGTSGAALDAFARQALWERGLDFDHGTGHGVGSFLSVHEGPHSISKRSLVALEPGMIVSNEPGYYKEGSYGIRLENLLVVNPLESVSHGDREVMTFETITLAPFDRRLVERRLLTDAERQWLDAYHARVRKAIGPHLGTEDRAWLETATAPL